MTITRMSNDLHSICHIRWCMASSTSPTGYHTTFTWCHMTPHNLRLCCSYGLLNKSDQISDLTLLYCHFHLTLCRENSIWDSSSLIWHHCTSGLLQSWAVDLIIPEHRELLWNPSLATIRRCMILTDWALEILRDEWLVRSIAFSLPQALSLLKGLPKSPAVFTLMGKVHQKAGHFDSAAENFQRALQTAVSTGVKWLGVFIQYPPLRIRPLLGHT